MKKILFFLLSFSLTTFSLSAQNTTQPKQQSSPGMHQHMQGQDHFMFYNGKLYQMKQGVRTEVKKTIQLKNGTSVHPDGSYSLKGKPSMQLKNGEGMDMNGNVFQSGGMHHGGDMPAGKMCCQTMDSTQSKN